MNAAVKKTTTSKTKKTKAPKKEAVLKIEIQVLKDSGKPAETLAVDKLISGSDVHSHLMHQAAVVAQANIRLGTAKTKNRAEVRGGGKKPWKQKHTGNARHGSIRSPIWRKGGVVFGPEGHKYGIELPRRMKIAALVASLKTKAARGKLFMVEDIVSKEGKTREMATFTEKFAFNKPLFIRDGNDPMTTRAIRNLPRVALATSDSVAPFDVLACDECVVTRKGYEKLLTRLKNGVSK